MYYCVCRVFISSANFLLSKFSACPLCVFITAVPITKRWVGGFITAGPIIKLCAGRGTVWDSITGTCVCVYYCSTYYKAVRVGGGRGGLGLRRLVFHDNVGVCVFITAGPITKLFARGGGR